MIHIKKYKFSGHQTFVLRFGWLEKGFAFISAGKQFSDPNAIVDLGVGKNMVDSIRYWCELTGIVQDGEVTNFGRRLLDEQNGWDPFLEDNASWWLLHWRLVANPIFQTAGTALFSALRKPEFSKHDVAEAVLRMIPPGKKAPSEKIIMRDIDCYLRSYCGLRRFEKKKGKEELFESPLQDLNLIQPMIDGGMFRFSIGRKASLPPEIIGYTISDYMNGQKKQSTTIQELLYKQGSPGQVFMLDENALVEAVQELQENPRWGTRFNFTESAGIAQIHCTILQEEADQLLDSYYFRKEDV